VTVIRLDNVSKRYGEVTAVGGVSLEIMDGEFFFLLGPSGCGKTTLLRMIAGFAEPDEGQVYFDGHPMNHVPAHRRGLAMVFQSYALWPHMTVAENVGYGLEVRKVAGEQRRQRVAKALELVRMGRLAGRYPAELSGGEQQRVALARALVVEPRAVLLDEPLSNLDARLRLEMREELRQIHRRTGITMLYVTHDQKEALSMAQRLALMNQGRVVQVGTPTSIYHHPASRFAAEFIGETNLLEAEVLGSEDGTVALRTPVGELVCAGGDKARAGEKLLVSVRPEALALVTEPDDGASQNTFPAVIEDVTYLGETSQFVLRAGSATLKCLTLARPVGGRLKPGQRTRFHIPPDSAVLLPLDA